MRKKKIMILLVSCCDNTELLSYCFFIWIEVLVLFFVNPGGVSGADGGTPGFRSHNGRHVLHVFTYYTSLMLKWLKLYVRWTLVIYTQQHP